jgi:hypothetical protein
MILAGGETKQGGRVRDGGRHCETVAAAVERSCGEARRGCLLGDAKDMPQRSGGRPAALIATARRAAERARGGFGVDGIPFTVQAWVTVDRWIRSLRPRFDWIVMSRVAWAKRRPSYLGPPFG